MKLSDAILFGPDPIIARLVKESKKRGEPVFRTVTAAFPIASKQVLCPQCIADGIEVRSSLFRVIPHLDADHNWSRSKVAEFVAGLEASEEDVAVQ